MSAAAAEFSRLVRLARLGAEPFRQQISASEPERAALARRFGLVTLDRLAAVVELVRAPDDTIVLEASFEAEFAQECVVTLDPVTGAVTERFTLRYGGSETEAEIGADDDAAFEPLVGETIDIGEAVAQEFSLALPPFPRSPDASVDAEAEPPRDSGPFAVLSRRV